MGLLSEIQSDAIGSDARVAPLLRKCLVLAARLDSDVLVEWVRHELNGYPDDVDVPDYRIMDLRFKGHFLGPYGAQMQNAPVPPHVVTKIAGKDCSKYYARQAVSTIDAEDLMKAGGVMIVNYDNLGLLMNGKVFGGYSAAQFWGEVPTMAVAGIVDAVKTRVLDYSLTLGKRYPVAGEIGGMGENDKTAKQDMHQIFNQTIMGNVGVVGNPTNSSITLTVNNGSIESLRSSLRSKGVDDRDIAELEEAIRDDEVPTEDDKYGPKVTSWIGKMMAKAGAGVWNVGLKVGGELIAKALSGYYGLG